MFKILVTEGSKLEFTTPAGEFVIFVDRKGQGQCSTQISFEETNGNGELEKPKLVFNKIHPINKRKDINLK